MSWKRALLVAALASLTLSAVLAIAILLFGEFGEAQVRILATTFSISLYSLLALPGALLAERRHVPSLALATVAAAVIAFALVVIGVWFGDDVETLWKLAGTVTMIALALAQTAATTIRRVGDVPAVGPAFVAATATIVVVALLVVNAIWREPDGETYFRVLAALAVLDVFFVILQPLLGRLRVRDSVTVVLEGTREQVDAAVARVEGTGVRIRR